MFSKLIVTGVLVMIASTVSGNARAEDQMVPSCGDPTVDLNSVAIGFKCVTSKGFEFQSVSRGGFPHAWLAPDGLIWTDVVAKGSWDVVAMNICNNSGGYLPMLPDFQRGETYGFREVLPNMDRQYWTKTCDNNHRSAGYCFVYDGRDGSSFATDSSRTAPIRCLIH